MRALILALLFAAACTHAAIDAGSDLAPSDGPSAPAIDGGIACGTLTCNAGQVCFIGCTGLPCDMAGGAGDCRPHACVDLPAACATSYTCSCFSRDWCPMGSCAMGSIFGRTITCGGCL